jgi:hypothetical protein
MPKYNITMVLPVVEYVNLLEPIEAESKEAAIEIANEVDRWNWNNLEGANDDSRDTEYIVEESEDAP